MKKNVPFIHWRFVVLFIIILLILFGLYYIFSTYSHLMTSKVNDKDKTIKLVLANTEITEIENIYEFSYTVSYHIVIGKTKDGERQYVYVPIDEDEDEKDIIIYSEEQFVSVEKLQQDWQNSCEGCELKRSNPAMIDKQPLWEIAYEDQLNRYVITYIALLDGSVYEQMKLTRKYSKG